VIQGDTESIERTELYVDTQTQFVYFKLRADGLDVEIERPFLKILSLLVCGRVG
jgi:hypothetical protein